MLIDPTTAGKALKRATEPPTNVVKKFKSEKPDEV